ncbi:PREDICTED: tubulin-folding cofactor B [Pseudopodoces humilis]|uniref:tubulin-folding cofactor B n=1 Tax=Pseudopodoces humilis TaxID=181119 RepID=UPI0006B747A9|nr:PREDICTED: tubulin-folding cofactor B [Pseudopodoces humilis]
MNGGGAGPGPVWLAVSSSLNAFRACKRFSPALTIAELKCKLELVVGSPASCMQLELFGAQDEPLGPLDCDEALLGSFPISDGCRVHVTDRSGARAGQFEDLSQVAKYEMAESDYDKRTARRRATIAFVGETDFKPGFWVGVRYDEPLGKHDGSVGGRRYFECPPKYGAFVKPQNVVPGDFPEEDDGLDDEL